MPDPSYRVSIVVDPNFGSRLHELAARMHVWAVDTPPNRAAAERIWAKMAAPIIERGVTIFQAKPGESPDQRVVGILGDVALHHGAYSHDPAVSILEIHGAPLTNILHTALREMGFASQTVGDMVLAAASPAA